MRSFPGHTGGDCVVVIEDANVVLCGDLFWRNTLLNLIDASTADWIATLTPDGFATRMRTPSSSFQ